MCKKDMMILYSCRGRGRASVFVIALFVAVILINFVDSRNVPPAAWRLSAHVFHKFDRAFVAHDQVQRVGRLRVCITHEAQPQRTHAAALAVQRTAATLSNWFPSSSSPP